MRGSELSQAWSIAEQAFKNKKDLSGEPYMKHVHAVWLNTCSLSVDVGHEIIAILHDLLEDCPEWTEEKLLDMFPKRIVEGIVSMTHKKGQSYDQYIDQIMKNQDAVIVKLADLKHNMDVTRLPELDEKAINRLKKYHSAYLKLKP